MLKLARYILWCEYFSPNVFTNTTRFLSQEKENSLQFIAELRTYNLQDLLAPYWCKIQGFCLHNKLNTPEEEDWNGKTHTLCTEGHIYNYCLFYFELIFIIYVLHFIEFFRKTCHQTFVSFPPFFFLILTTFVISYIKRKNVIYNIYNISTLSNQHAVIWKWYLPIFSVFLSLKGLCGWEMEWEM